MDLYSWAHWNRHFMALRPSTRRLAARLGVEEGFIAKRCGGARDTSGEVSERHARFAAACAVEQLLREKPAWQVADVWGQADTITRAGMAAGGFLLAAYAAETRQQWVSLGFPSEASGRSMSIGLGTVCAEHAEPASAPA